MFTKFKKKFKCVIGISTYNDFQLVDGLLKTIRYYTNYPLDEVAIVVCDDGSREEFKLGLRHIIIQNRSWHENLVLIEHKVNQGISATWNHIVDFLDAEYVVMLNNDILATRNWLTSLMYFLENNSHVGMVSLPSYFIRPLMVKSLIEEQDAMLIQTVDPNSKKSLECIPHNYQKRTDGAPGRVMAAAGMCFGMKVETLRQLGGFDEGRFRSFYEEIDMGTACAQSGKPSYSLPYPHIYHIWGHTFNTNPELDAVEVMSRSRANYIAKWGGDITEDDVHNPHYKFMRLIEPYKINWIDFAESELGYREMDYQETDNDVKVSANVKRYFELLESHNIKLEDI